MNKRYVIVPESVGSYVKHLIKTINKDFNTEAQNVQVLGGGISIYELSLIDDNVFNEYLKRNPTEEILKEIEANITVTLLEQEIARDTERLELLKVQLAKLKGV